MKTKDLVLCAMFVALIAVGAFIKVPVPVVPFTLQFLFTMLAGLLLAAVLAALTAACYLVRDGQMKGEHIHLFEKGSIPGGACDGCQ